MSEHKEQSRPSEEEQPVKWMKVPPMKIPVSSCPNAYQSKEAVQKARRNGTFDINKTMVYKNGRLFFLCTTD